MCVKGSGYGSGKIFIIINIIEPFLDGRMRLQLPRRQHCGFRTFLFREGEKDEGKEIT